MEFTVTRLRLRVWSPRLHAAISPDLLRVMRLDFAVDINQDFLFGSEPVLLVFAVLTTTAFISEIASR